MLLEKDVTGYVKEWVGKTFIDETFEQLKVRKYHEKFSDTAFPANSTSLGEKIVKRFKDLEWRLASDFIEPHGALQVVDLEKEQNVNQGRIGDCYLLNPIGLLAIIQKSMILRLFTIREPNEFGYYSVWLFIDGKWRYIIVDENFPWWTTKQKPYFCDLVASNQIWPMIIEKAWAKLHGEYSRLWGGDTGLAFRVITGAPTVAYGLTKYRKDPRKKEHTFKKIDMHLAKGHLISITTGALDDHARTFLTQGHSYALIAHKEEEKKFIVRDPRGPTNVFGKEIYEIDEIQLIYLFQCAIVCVLETRNLFTEHSINFEGVPRSENLTKLIIPSSQKKMSFYLSIYQANKRFMLTPLLRQKRRSCYVQAKLLKLDFTSNEVIKAKTINQKSSKGCSIDMELSLTPGTYYLYLIVQNSNAGQEVVTLNIAAYAPQYVDFKELSSQKKLSSLKAYIDAQKAYREAQSRAKKEKKDESGQRSTLQYQSVKKNQKKQKRKDENAAVTSCSLVESDAVVASTFDVVSVETEIEVKKQTVSVILKELNQVKNNSSNDAVMNNAKQAVKLLRSSRISLIDQSKGGGDTSILKREGKCIASTLNLISLAETTAICTASSSSSSRITSSSKIYSMITDSNNNQKAITTNAQKQISNSSCILNGVRPLRVSLRLQKQPLISIGEEQLAKKQQHSQSLQLSCFPMAASALRERSEVFRMPQREMLLPAIINPLAQLILHPETERGKTKNMLKYQKKGVGATTKIGRINGGGASFTATENNNKSNTNIPNQVTSTADQRIRSSEVRHYRYKASTLPQSISKSTIFQSSKKNTPLTEISTSFLRKQN